MAKLERKSKNEEILSINEELNQCVFTKEGNHFVAAFEMNKNAVRLTVANINLSKSYKCPFPLEDFKSILHPKIVEYPEKVRRNILSWFKHGRFDFNIKEGNEDIAVLRFHNNLDEFEEVVLVIELIKIKDQKIEINALNEMLLQQSNQIEVLYTKAVQGNKSSKSDNQRAMINKLDDQLNEQNLFYLNVKQKLKSFLVELEKISQSLDSIEKNKENKYIEQNDKEVRDSLDSNTRSNNKNQTIQKQLNSTKEVNPNIKRSNDSDKVETPFRSSMKSSSGKRYLFINNNEDSEYINQGIPLKKSCTTKKKNIFEKIFT